jgi:hypothetical protein
MSKRKASPKPQKAGTKSSKGKDEDVSEAQIKAQIDLTGAQKDLAKAQIDNAVKLTTTQIIASLVTAFAGLLSAAHSSSPPTLPQANEGLGSSATRSTQADWDLKVGGLQSLYWFLGSVKRMLLDESNKEQTPEEKAEVGEVLKAIESAETSILSAPDKFRDKTPFALSSMAKSILEAQLLVETVESLMKQLERLKTETRIGSSNLFLYIAAQLISYRNDAQSTLHYRTEAYYPPTISSFSRGANAPVSVALGGDQIRLTGERSPSISSVFFKDEDISKYFTIDPESHKYVLDSAKLIRDLQSTDHGRNAIDQK